VSGSKAMMFRKHQAFSHQTSQISQTRWCAFSKVWIHVIAVLYPQASICVFSAEHETAFQVDCTICSIS